MPAKADIPWTLRCKIHTITVMITAPKNTPLSTFKDEILNTLQTVYPTGSIDTEDGSIPLPHSPDEITLGKLVDTADVHSGWQMIEEDHEGITPKGKGKAAVGKALPNGVSKTTIETVGLKDFALVALRFRGFTGLVHTSIEADAEQDDWHIVLPQQAGAAEDGEGEAPGLPAIDPLTGRPA